MKLTSVLAILLSTACNGRWVVFGSPPDMPWAWGPVTGSGCRCGCDDLDRCIADSLAPLDQFAGLVAQHNCGKNIEGMKRWHEVRTSGCGRLS